jgi:DMSO/TMAO reductase YedYZ molybdopterin-dependent catalytic subunit
MLVDGAVRRPIEYALTDLASAPHRTVVATLECAGNGRSGFGRTAVGEVAWGEGAVSTAVWEGVPLRWLIRRAGLSPGAREVVFRGFDQPKERSSADPGEFARSLPLSLVMGNSDILVATRMNGVALPKAHGAPARLVVPGWYAMASVKWLQRVTIATEPFDGYFQSSKYVYRVGSESTPATRPVTRIRVKAIVTDPPPNVRVRFGEVRSIRGKAWSGGGRVVRVEVHVGAGWVPCRISPGRGEYEWVDWEYRWRPSKLGVVGIRARATDASGAVQPTRPYANRFQYGYNAVRTVPVEVVSR